MGWGANAKRRIYLAKLSGVLAPKRVPTIPFNTRLGPVPVRVPTCIIFSFNNVDWKTQLASLVTRLYYHYSYILNHSLTLRLGVTSYICITITNPASVCSIGDREIEKFPDFPPPVLPGPHLPHLLHPSPAHCFALVYMYTAYFRVLVFLVKFANLTLVSVPCKVLEVKLNQYSLNYWHLE